MQRTSVLRYRLLKSALPAEERRALTTYFPVLFAIYAGGLIISLFLGLLRRNPTEVTIVIAIATGLYLSCIAIFVPVTLKRRLRESWDTYELEIGNDYLLRRLGETPDLHIKFDEITRLERIPGRYLLVFSSDKQRTMGVPEGIENFDEVLRLVSTGHTITIRSGELWYRRALYLAVGSIAFLTMLWSKSPYLFTALAIALFVAVLWAVVSVHRNPNSSRYTRRAVWSYLLVLIPCVQRLIEGVRQLSKH